MAFSDLLALGDGAIRDVLGDTVTYAPSSGDPVEVTGIFDAAYRVVDEGQAGFSTAQPSVWFLLSDLPDGAETDYPTVTVGGTDYVANEIQPDGCGGIRFLLHEQP